MVSIIICSRGPEFRAATTESIATTIGVPYELVAVENGQGQYGICEAYNIGAAQAKYPLLCFMHEDIAFRTNNWGKIVEQVLLDNSIGAIGVTGGKWLPKAPCTWWSCGNKYLTSNVISEDIKSGYCAEVYSNPESKQVTDVAVVDGMWICCRKEVWTKFKFDAVVFSAFHFYDVDFCTRVFTKYKNYVTFDVSIEHFSVGSQNNSWYENATTYYRKRQSYLPFGSVKLSGQEDKKVTLQVFQQFISGYIDNNLSFGRGIRLISDYLLLASFNRESLGLLKKYLKKKILR